MAYSGTGSGTQLDPYILTTSAQLDEMAQQDGGYIYTGNYFKLGNNIDVGNKNIQMIGQHIDGDGWTLYNWVRSSPSSGQPFLKMQTDGGSFRNIKCNIKVISKVYNCDFIERVNRYNFTIENVEILLDPTGDSLDSILGICDISWTINNIKAEGNIWYFVYNFISSNHPVLSNIKFLTTYRWRPVFIRNEFRGTCYRCQVIVTSEYLPSSNTFTFFSPGLRGNALIDESFAIVNSVSSEQNTSFTRTMDSTAKIRNTYVKFNNILTNKVSLPLDGIFSFTTNNGNATGLIENSFSLVNNVSYNKPNTKINFNDLSQLDWYIPSIDELKLIWAIRTNVLFDSVIRTKWQISPMPSYEQYFYPISSSESSSTGMNVLYGNNVAYNQPKSFTSFTQLYSVILVRNLINIPAELNVGNEYQGTVIIYKNGTSGIGSAKQPLAGGLRLFSFGSNNLLVGTSTTIGSGYNNTLLIEQSRMYNSGCTNWRNYELPFPIPFRNFTNTSGTTTNSHSFINDIEYNKILDDPEWTFESKAGLNYNTVSASKNIQTFSGWDFENIWNAPDLNNEISLKYNQLEEYETTLVFIISISRESQNSIFIKAGLVIGSNSFGIKVLNKKTNTQIHKALGSDHLIELPGELDYDLLITPYIVINEIESDSIPSNYFHYYNDPLSITSIEVEGYQVLEKDNKSISYIHGSLIHNGYIYGSPRDPTPSKPISFVRIPINDSSNFELLEILYPQYSVYNPIAYNEQIVKIGDYIFSLGFVFTAVENAIPYGAYLIMINTTNFSYKIFKLPTINWHTQPISSDNTYLYINVNNGTYKVDPTIYIDAQNQFYIDDILTPDNWGQPGWYYSNNLQGGHIVGNYSSTNKGRVHSSVSDSTYLYLAHTTGGHENPYELQVIRKSDMTPAGWCFIPKSTDDMTQNHEWLFFGIEVLVDNPLIYGNRWGTCAIKKSDVIGLNLSGDYVDPVKGINQLERYYGGIPVSYASVVFGNYLFDFRTNRRVYVIDISDPSQWSLDDYIGKYTLAIIELKNNGEHILFTPNEALLDNDENINVFFWGTPSGYAKFSVPDFDLTIKALGYFNEVKIIAAYIDNVRILRLLKENVFEFLPPLEYLKLIKNKVVVK